MRLHRTVMNTLLLSLCSASHIVAAEDIFSASEEQHNLSQIEHQLTPYESWKNTKQQLSDNHNLKLNVDYNMLGLTSTDTIGNSSAGGGALRVFGQWDIIHSDDGSTGGLVFKVEHRHSYLNSSPKDFGIKDLGYLGFAHSLIGDQGLRATHLFWRHSLLEDNMVIYAGFLDMTDYTDLYPLASPWNDFNNAVFTVGSGTIGGLPDGALGVMVGGYLSDSIYASGSVLDAKGNASSLSQGAEDFMDSGATWKSLEFGFAPSKAMMFVNNIHLSLWQRDAVDNDKEGYGVNISAWALMSQQWIPFIRAGWAVDGGAMYDASVSAGLGYIPSQRSQDMFGFALNWASPMESTFGNIDIEDQYTAEMYYRSQLTPWFQLSPSIQVLNHTAVDLSAIQSGDLSNGLIKDKTNIVFGLKAQFTF